MKFPAHHYIKSAFVDLLRQRGEYNFEINLTDMYEDLADYFNLTPEEKSASYQEVNGKGSNTENYWKNAIRTAKARLIDEGVLERNPGRGICKLTVQAIANQPPLPRDTLVSNLVSPVQPSASPQQTAQQNITRIITAKEQQYTTNNLFDPSSITDGQQRILASVVRRRGQPAFRKQLLIIYGGKCAISGTNAEKTLEAAHIVPYQGQKTNHPTNGLLLRSDLHTLFDLRLVTVDTAHMTIIVALELINTDYEIFQGISLRLPSNQAYWPNIPALDMHRRESGL